MNVTKLIQFGLGLCLIVTTSVFASGYTELRKQAGYYDWDMCVATYANRCIDTVCLLSEERDCVDVCQSRAYAKCVLEEQNY